LPDRLLFACRTGCCRTTLAAGTSSWGSGSGFARPSPNSPRFSVPFCPVAGRVAAVAGREVVPVRAAPDPLLARPEADVVPSLGRAEPEPDDPDAARPLAVPVRAPDDADPVRAPPVAALAAPAAPAALAALDP
jgi:hypothetical protein